MADSRYGDRGSYGRSDSIFSDDDRSRSRERNSYGEGSRDREGGGFFQTVQRAGEEVRSWFSDDDDRERSPRSGMNRSNHRDYESRNRNQSGYGSGRQDYDRGYGSGGREFGGVQSWGQANDARDYDRDERWGGGSDWRSGQQGGRGSSDDYRGGSSPFDDHYRSWRDQHISQLDREYDEYCRHRQQEFESDFGNWRKNRQGQGGSGGGMPSGQGGSETGRSSGRTESSSSDMNRSGAMASGGSTAQGGSEQPAAQSGTAGSATASGTRTGSRKSQDTK